jgi:hypothetical protein
VLVGFDADLDAGGLSGRLAVIGGTMRLGTLALLLTLITAPACGGGASPDSGVAGSPGPLSASFVPDQPSPGSNTVAMIQASKSNDVVNVWVTLNNTNGVFGTAFDVVFDPGQAAYLGYTKGIVFEANGGAPSYTVDGTSNPGRIVVGIARTNGSTTNVSGMKAMLTLQFRVKQAGTNPVTLQNSILYDGQATPQPLPGILWFAGAIVGV